jgi:GC-rich sequence DNA-binding factor
MFIVTVIPILTSHQFSPLEKLEDEHISILQERSDMITRRYRLDDEDDLATFLGSLPTPQAETEQVDDLGRIIPTSNPLAARRDRRTARGVRRTYRRGRSQTTETVEEGYSTDSSLASSDAANYRTALSKLSSDSAKILADVRAEEFKDPSQGIGKWFSEWREKWGDSYTNAWGGLGLVAAWEFWVRLEVVGWNPFEVDFLFTISAV